MGQSSSQLDQPSQPVQNTTPPATATDEQEPRAAPVDTTASEQLERDLMDVSQDGKGTQKEKSNKRKRKSTEEQESPAAPIDNIASDQLEHDLLDASQDGKGKLKKHSNKKRKRKSTEKQPDATRLQENGHVETNGAAASANVDEQQLGALDEEPSAKHLSPLEKSLATVTFGRKEIQRMLKRKELEDIVLSGKGHWRKLPDGKWGVKLHKEGEAPQKRPLTEDEIEDAVVRKREIERLKYVEGVAFANERKARDALERSKGRVMDEKENEVDAVREAHAAKKASAKKASPRTRENAEIVQKTRRVSSRQGPERHEDTENREPLQIAKEASSDQLHEPIYKLPEHVGDWLDDHATHGVAQLTKNAMPTQNAPSNKRKRTSRFQDDDSDEYRGGKEDSLGPSDSYSVAEPPKKKPKRKSALGQNAAQSGSPKSAKKEATPHDTPQKSTPKSTKKKVVAEDKRPAPTAHGPFTAEEKATVDRIFEQTLVRCKLTQAELQAMIRNYREAGEFKTELENALPNRSRDMLRKFAQRRYHQCERGPWTPEQDDALRNAHAQWPGKWTEISKRVDRTAGDCKDRWNKVLSKKMIGPWSTEEESDLMAKVGDAIGKIKREFRNDPALLNDHARLEGLISWTTIAEQLGGTRSMKQCREKYHKLHARKNKPDSAVGSHPARNGQATPLTNAEDLATMPRTKMRDAIPHLNQFELGDYYDVFVEIHKSFPDHNVRFSSDEVVWSMVPWKNPGSRFSMPYFGGALRKAAFENAIRNWPNDSKKIRRKLEQAETIPAKALALATIIEKKTGPEGLDQLPRTYEPDLVGKSSEEILQIKRQRKAMRRAKKTEDQSKPSNLSKDVISDSEAEDDAEPVKREVSATPDVASEDEQDDAEVNASPESSEDEIVQDSDADHAKQEDEDDDEQSPDEAEEDSASEIVPETQLGHSQTPARQVANATDTPKSSLKKNSKLSPEDFMQRCSDSGKSKKQAFTPVNKRPITYSKKDRSASRRRT